MDMEWNVYHYNSNSKDISKWNIFNNWVFKRDVEGLINSECYTKHEFLEKLKSLLFYYFWGRCEYELILSPWIGDCKEIKIDAYAQVKMNFDKFANYIWSFKNKTTKEY